jgi:predicted SnoaL-like aldol condensation-catalyzing enzyme
MYYSNYYPKIAFPMPWPYDVQYRNCIPVYVGKTYEDRYTTPYYRSPKTEKNKNIIRRYFQTVINGQNLNAAKDFIAKDYIQHNPTFPPGLQAFIDTFKNIFEQRPGFHAEIKRMIAEDDYVVVHSHVTGSPTDRGNALVDIYRLKNGKIVEHWDVIQPVPEQSANPYTMF